MSEVNIRLAFKMATSLVETKNEFNSQTKNEFNFASSTQSFNILHFPANMAVRLNGARLYGSVHQPQDPQPRDP